MSKDMLDVCSWAIDTAKKAGADDCKAKISKSRFVEVEYRERKPEKIKEATTQRLDVDIYVDQRYSSQDTSDLRPEPLQEFISKAIQNTKLLEADQYRTLPDPKYYEGRAHIDLKISDPALGGLTAEQRHDMVKEIEAACLERGGDKIISVTASVYDEFYEEAVMTSNGLEARRESTECWAQAEATLQDEGDRRPTAYHWAGSRTLKNLPDPESVGRVAAERAFDLLGAKKIDTETLPVIIENRNVGRILGGFMEALYGRNIQQKRSFLSEKKGEKIGSDLFTLIDDPHIMGALGSRLYDDDGFPTKKRTIIDKGVLNEFLVDWYYSRKLGWEPTSGGTTNVTIPPGKRSVKEIMKDLGRGIYITGFIGGNSNSTTGDASVGINGHLFENGELVQPVAEMNIADNHLKFWVKLVEVANDPWPYSSWQMPSLVFEDVVVSGV
jgi:PmbA protein